MCTEFIQPAINQYFTENRRTLYPASDARHVHASTGLIDVNVCITACYSIWQHKDMHTKKLLGLGLAADEREKIIYSAALISRN